MNPALVTVLALLVGFPATDSGEVSDPSDPSDPGTFADARNTYLLVEGGYGSSFQGSGRKLAIGSVGVERFVRDGISLGVAANGARMEQPGGHTSGASVQVVARWYVMPERSVTPFADAGSGGIVTEDPVPSRGTRYNFSSDIGIGVSARLSGRARLTAGTRWNHISNASLGDNNPGRDFIYGFAGVAVPL